jgi:hypothetical protein
MRVKIKEIFDIFLFFLLLQFSKKAHQPFEAPTKPFFITNIIKHMLSHYGFIILQF